MDREEDTPKEVDISDVLNALARVIDSTNEHDAARDKYEGYSWGYHGAGLIYNRDEARDDFAKRLDAYIDQRIEDKLATITHKNTRDS